MDDTQFVEPAGPIALFDKHIGRRHSARDGIEV
jgi:hypothetical protein